MNKLSLILKIVQGVPNLVGEIQEITEDKFVSLHEILCAIEDVARGFGVDPDKVGIEIRKDGSVGLVFKDVLKKEG